MLYIYIYSLIGQSTHPAILEVVVILDESFRLSNLRLALMAKVKNVGAATGAEVIQALQPAVYSCSSFAATQTSKAIESYLLTMLFQT